jgi:hypothetical protein
VCLIGLEITSIFFKVENCGKELGLGQKVKKNCTHIKCVKKLL